MYEIVKRSCLLSQLRYRIVFTIFSTPLYRYIVFSFLNHNILFLRWIILTLPTCGSYCSYKTRVPVSRLSSSQSWNDEDLLVSSHKHFDNNTVYIRQQISLISLIIVERKIEVEKLATWREGFSYLLDCYSAGLKV